MSLKPYFFNPIILGLGCASSIVYNKLIYHLDYTAIIPIVLVGFCGTHLAYSIPVIFFNGESKETLLRRIGTWWSAIFYMDFLIMTWAFLVIGSYAKMILLLVGIICLLYFFGLQTILFSIGRLRSIPFLKSLIIPTVWILVVVGLPIAAANEEPILFYQIELVRYFFLIIAISLAFDLKDYKVDLKNRLTSIPTYFGLELSRKISVACLVFYCITTYSQYQLGNIFYAAVFISLLGIYHLVKIKPQTQKTYSPNWVDGILIIQPLFYLLLNAFAT